MAKPFDMHDEGAVEPVPEHQRLAPGELVEAVVVCHHPFGIGMRVVGRGEYGHVDVPQISDGIINDSDDYPPIGATVRGRVIGYLGRQHQLRLSLRGA